MPQEVCINQLTLIDYIVVGLYIATTFFIGNYYVKKAGESVEEYFLSGRSFPWWLIGVSMAATNFSIDTPLALTKFVSANGVAGTWYYWASGISAVAATFVFSKLWRRAKVVTDNELIELRYSGRSAVCLRIFKGVYFGILINGFVLAWVFKALAKITTVVVPWDSNYVMLFFVIVTLIYTVSGGFYGVVLTDFIQYIFALGGSILLAIYAVDYVGGLDVLVTKIGLLKGQGFLDFTPRFDQTTNDELTFPGFVALFLIQWWAHKYSDGGGKHIQRMSAAKDEIHATWGTFFYAIFTYVANLWPWIVTALCALVVFEGAADFEKSYPMMMIRVLPHGILGLCVVSLIGAFMSTVDTHLNLGASYFINDIYKRFLCKNATDGHYVMVSRVSVVVIMMISVTVSFFIDSVGSFYLFVLTFASGAGLTWVLRWFWWRINAYSEISAMITSGIVASLIKIFYPETTFAASLVIIILVTVPLFIFVTLITKPSSDEVLREFYNRVRPSVLGWRPIINKYGLTHAPFLKQSLVNFALGVFLLIFCNIGIGTLLFKSVLLGSLVLVVCLAVAVFLIKRVA
ncbi:MAG: Na+:solute symporter [Deltaproteobacteria bacterium]|nr:Na+:solute symporter [Deltaproteobacteria bacterium]